MTDSIGPDRARLPIVATAAVAAAILVIAVCLGDPTGAASAVLGGVVAVVTVLAFGTRPFAGYLILLGSCITLLVFMVMPARGINAFDLLLLPILAGTYWGRPGRDAREDDGRESGAGHDLIRAAGRKLSRATVVFYAAAICSLFITVALGHRGGAMNSALNLVRAFQGLFLFPLGMVWLRSERRINAAIGAVLVGLAFLVVTNAIAATGTDYHRAGLAWTVNFPDTPPADPNEAATAMILIWTLLLARQATAPSWGNLLLMSVVLAMLVLTQSRSGLLAWVVFTLLSLRRGLWLYVVGFGVAAAIVVPLVFPHYVDRMGRTLVLQRGSFEAYSTLIRLYTWRAAWNAFLHHPIVGVGYLGFRHVSDQYNQLRAALAQAESLYLEIATGMGIVGLALFGNVLVRMIQTGRAVLRVAPRHSMGYHLARFHAPFIAALLAASITSDNLFGLVGLAQLAFWNALVLRAGHESLDAAQRAGPDSHAEARQVGHGPLGSAHPA